MGRKDLSVYQWTVRDGPVALNNAHLVRKNQRCKNIEYLVLSRVLICCLIICTRVFIKKCTRWNKSVLKKTRQTHAEKMLWYSQALFARSLPSCVWSGLSVLNLKIQKQGVTTEQLPIRVWNSFPWFHSDALKNIEFPNHTKLKNSLCPA